MELQCSGFSVQGSGLQAHEPNEKAQKVCALGFDCDPDLDISTKRSQSVGANRLRPGGQGYAGQERLIQYSLFNSQYSMGAFLFRPVAQFV